MHGFESQMPRRELFRRGAALGVGGTLASSVLAACGGGTSSAGGNGPLDVWAWQPPATGYPKVFAGAGKRVISDHEASAYNYTFIAGDVFITKLTTAAAGGRPPDVTEMQWTGAYHAVVDAHALAPLDALLPDLPTFSSSVMESLKVDGKTYAIPMDLNNLTIGYNKAIFDKLGLEIPTTLEELKALAKPLRAAGYQPLAMGLQDMWPASDAWFAYLGYTDPDAQMLRQADAGEGSFTSEPFLQAAQFCEEITQSGLVIDGASSLDVNGSIQLFGNQKAAMLYPVGNFFFGPINDAIAGKFEYGIFPFPPPAAGTKPRATGGPAILWSIPAKAQDVEGARDFIKHSTDAASAAALVANGFIPAFPNRTPPDDAPVFKRDPVFKDMLAFQDDAATRAMFSPRVFTALMNSMATLMAGKASAQDVVKQLQSAA